MKADLMTRSGEKCELCASTSGLEVYHVPPEDAENVDKSILTCDSCLSQINGETELDVNHWRCLSDSMWSEHLAVQIVAWRVLGRLGNSDLQSQIYLEEDALEWAEFGMIDPSAPVTKDSNGAVLNAGDSVTLIKDLVVKGANFTAKRGTMVRNISLTNNPEHIEGKVNGTQIVLVANFLKKV